MHQDLGVIDGPVLLFGGPYSNLQATEALFKQAMTLGMSGPQLICTGDVVAYCADPSATVQAIRASGAVVVAGNCEKQLGQSAPGCGCGFDSGSACDMLSAKWYGYADAQVSKNDRAWMLSCPDIVSFWHQGARYAVVHGGATDIARFIWQTSDDGVFAQEFAAVRDAIGPVDHVIAGHSGVPFLRDTGQGQWINAGVIGMPPHDGTQQTRYAILDGGEVLFHCLQYNVEGAFGAMERAGLTQGYHRALKLGYWPSEDVLPVSLRAPSFASG